jgi:hypothetical protein
MATLIFAMMLEKMEVERATAAAPLRMWGEGTRWGGFTVYLAAALLPASTGEGAAEFFFS